MSNVQQILETAKKQHEKGQLNIYELECIYERWGVSFIIDGDKINENVLI